jgi:glycosyltransferase involved in cell wall biosynthesis
MCCPRLRDLPLPPPGRTGWPWTEESTKVPETTPAGTAWPKISIVTPSFNQGEFIEETIRSVLLQGYPDIEYIIMDGGSSDQTVEIIKKYESWITFWVSEKDNGQSSAINKGWRRVTGEIISYLNSDDTLLKDALSIVSSCFEKDDHIGMVFGDAVFINQSSNKLMVFKGKEYQQSDLFFRLSNIGQPATFYKRSVIDKIGYLNEALHYSMDFDFWLRLSVYYDIVYVQSVLATMRIHSGAKTVQDFQLFYLDELTSLKSIFQQKDIPENLTEIRDKAYSYCYLRGGYRAFQLGDMQNARNLLVTAMRMHFRFLLNPVHFIILMMTFLPAQFVRRLYRAKSILLKRKNFIDLLLESDE